MSKQFWGILALVALLLGGIFVFTNKPDNTSTTNTKAGAVTKHITGDTTSKVKLQEYGDYQCPVCGTFFPVTKQVIDKYKDRVEFQFSNLPLTQLHPNAFAAARAAEAAGKQNKYFEMHDLLYQNQSVWSDSSQAQAIFEGYASQLRLNMEQFRKDYASSSVNAAINADITAFKKTGADMGTPTYFLNGKKLENNSLFDGNSPSLDKFSKLIDAELAKQQPTAKNQ